MQIEIQGILLVEKLLRPREGLFSHRPDQDLDVGLRSRNPLPRLQGSRISSTRSSTRASSRAWRINRIISVVRALIA